MSSCVKATPLLVETSSFFTVESLGRDCACVRGVSVCVCVECVHLVS